MWDGTHGVTRSMGEKGAAPLAETPSHGSRRRPLAAAAAGRGRGREQKEFFWDLGAIFFGLGVWVSWANIVPAAPWRRAAEEAEQDGGPPLIVLANYILAPRAVMPQVPRLRRCRPTVGEGVRGSLKTYKFSWNSSSVSK